MRSQGLAQMAEKDTESLRDDQSAIKEVDAQTRCR